MPKSMQVDAKSKGLPGALAHGIVNGPRAHRGALIGRPQAGMGRRTRNTAPKLLQVQIDSRGQFFPDRIVERPPAFGILGRDLERPKIAGSHEVFAHAQRGKRALAWYEE